MRSSVQTAWPNFVTFYEGRLSWLYLDTKALVTTGIGFLMDTGTGQAPESCLALPWVDQGMPATRAQIGSAWSRVKARTDLAPKGGYAFKDVTTLRLSDQTISALLNAKTLEFWSVLVAQLPGLEQWPADAQLALMDMAWHMGPRFLGSRWPNFTAAAHASDFAGMAEHCQTANQSPRDARHVHLFSNAALVVKLGLDPGRLWDDLTPEQEVPVSDFNEKVQWDGPYVGRPRYVDRRTLDQLHELEHIVGHRVVMYQGSWSDGDLSADTHAGAGAADIGPTGGDGWRELETAGRKVGGAAFLRDWPQNYHVHFLSIGNPYLAPWAKVQVEAYFDGYDGLGPNARSGPDTGNRSYVDITWEEYMPTAADIAKATVAEQIRRGPELGKAIAKGFLTADDIIPAGKDETNETNTHQVPATFITGDHDLLVDIRDAIEKLAAPPTT
jgi:hypothetical protein